MTWYLKITKHPALFCKYTKPNIVNKIVCEQFPAECCKQKSVKNSRCFNFPHAFLLTPSVARKTSNGKKKTIH
jgi:hypothetical protein